MATRWCSLGFALLLCALGSEALAQERELVVRSDPSGAQVHLAGELLGVTPLRVERSLSARFTLELRLAGHQSARVEVVPLASPVKVAVPLRRLAGRILVTCEGELPLAYDGRVSLREALLYARGERTPKGADRAYVRGPVGRGRPDRIVVHPAVAAAGALFVGRDLPPLDDPGDVLAGPAEGVLTLLPAAGASCTRGLELGSGVRVERLRIEGFPCGVRARGLGEARLAQVEVQSPYVALEARAGATLRCDGVAARASYARRIADGISLVLGELASPAPRPRRLVTTRSPLGVRATLTGGDFTHRARLYQLEGRPSSLSAWEGVEARSSSGQVNAVFGSVLSEHASPARLLDGDPKTVFRWAEKRRGAGAWLSFDLKRPARGQRFRLLPERGGELQRLRLTLLDPFGQPVASRELGPLRGPAEVVFPQPHVFQVLRLEVLAASTRSPGLREVEAQLWGSREVPRLGAAEGCAVFAPRELTREAVLTSDRRLLTLPRDAFRGELPLRLPVGSAPPYVRRAPTRFQVTTLADEVRRDGQLSLREALDSWARRAPLSQGEEQHVRRAKGPKGRIVLPPGTIKLARPLPPLPPYLELCGDPQRGTKLVCHPAQPSLRAAKG